MPQSREKCKCVTERVSGLSPYIQKKGELVDRIFLSFEGEWHVKDVILMLKSHNMN